MLFAATPWMQPSPTTEGRTTPLAHPFEVSAGRITIDDQGVTQVIWQSICATSLPSCRKTAILTGSTCVRTNMAFGSAGEDTVPNEAVKAVAHMYGAAAPRSNAARGAYYCRAGQRERVSIIPVLRTQLSNAKERRSREKNTQLQPRDHNRAHKKKKKVTRYTRRLESWPRSCRRARKAAPRPGHARRTHTGAASPCVEAPAPRHHPSSSSQNTDAQPRLAARRHPF